MNLSDSIYQRIKAQEKIDNEVNNRQQKRLDFIIRLAKNEPFKAQYCKPKIDTLAGRIRNNLIKYNDEDWCYLHGKLKEKKASRLLSLGYRRNKRLKEKQFLNEYFGLHYVY